MQDVEEEEDNTCGACQGTGMAFSGPPDAKGHHCHICKGRGYHRDEPTEQDPDDARDEWLMREAEEDV